MTIQPIIEADCSSTVILTVLLLLIDGPTIEVYI